MNRIARSLIGMSLLLLVGGPLNPVHAYQDGRFIEARDLTQLEKAAVTRLTEFTGKQPWLIFGLRFGTNPQAGSDRTVLDVYMQPDVENGRLRRGRRLTMSLGRTKPGQPPSWHVDAVTKYAQVVIIGRRVDQVTRWDATMPFPVADDLDDPTIVGLVDFIRTSPERSDPLKNVAPQKVDGSMAITRIRRTPKGLQVDLQNRPGQGVHVLVEQRRESWTVLQITFWIA